MAMPDKDDPSQDGWDSPRLKYLEKLISAAQQGQHLSKDDAKEIDGLEEYIAKGLPGADRVKAKLAELRTLMGLPSEVPPDDGDEKRIPKFSDTKSVFGDQYQQKAIPDDGMPDVTMEEAKKPIFGEEYQQKTAADDAPISSAKEAVEHLNKKHFEIYIKGKYKVVRENPDAYPLKIKNLSLFR
jgi:hypothetical protein